VFKTVKGHTIQLEDKDGEEMIVIKQAVDDSTFNLIVMNQDGIRIVDAAGHMVEMTEDGITLTNADEDVVKLSGGEITVEAGSAITLKASSITIEGDEVTISATGKLAASGSPVHLNP